MKFIKGIKKRINYYFGTAKKIGFVVAGTQKAGTSALDALLRQHHEICMPTGKEVHFFDTDKYFINGKADYRIYHSFFEPNPSHKILGEITPVYMYWHETPRRIWEYNPDIKIVIILRNPIERAFSHWNMQRDRGRETRTFWSAINSEREKTRESLPFQNKSYSYIDRGFYTEQIKRIQFYFPDEQILILKYEDFLEQPNESLHKICSFLDIDNLGSTKHSSIHMRPYISSMTGREKNIFIIFSNMK